MRKEVTSRWMPLALPDFLCEHKVIIFFRLQLTDEWLTCGEWHTNQTLWSWWKAVQPSTHQQWHLLKYLHNSPMRRTWAIEHIHTQYIFLICWSPWYHLLSFLIWICVSPNKASERQILQRNTNFKHRQEHRFLLHLQQGFSVVLLY